MDIGDQECGKIRTCLKEMDQNIIKNSEEGKDEVRKISVGNWKRIGRPRNGKELNKSEHNKKNQIHCENKRIM